jgi:hypothetical protein
MPPKFRESLYTDILSNLQDFPEPLKAEFGWIIGICGDLWNSSVLHQPVTSGTIINCQEKPADAHAACDPQCRSLLAGLATLYYHALYAGRNAAHTCSGGGHAIAFAGAIDLGMRAENEESGRYMKASVAVGLGAWE